ncbi:MAG TPA: RDD family protein [Thermoplasmata archaeon]|nr:RDD family protein [Thermoplasmata archaeon]
MPSAIDLIGHNPALQEHWLRRLFAFLIDLIVVIVIFLFFAIPLTLFGYVWWLVPLFAGVLLFVYSFLLETLMGATIGKRLMSLRVVALDGNLDIIHAVFRNLSKLYWAVFLIDLFVGAATHGDPRQRLFDRLARTTVTRVDQGAYMEEQFRMMQHAPPYPITPSGTYPNPPPPRASSPPPAPGSANPAGGAWPGQAPTPSSWPQHSWDEQGRLVKEMKFCTACAGQLVARGDGKLTCVRCGAVY